MKVAYFGTPSIAVPPLAGLVEAGHDVELVVTGPDARRGRGRSTSPTPVKEFARSAGLEVTHDPLDVIERSIDLGVVVAFGQILRPPVLGHVPLVNLHFSALPRWRGAAPVERAILAGDASIGVCVMAIEAGLDTGGIYASAAVESKHKTLAELWAELSELGTQLLVDWLRVAFTDGQLVEPTPQRGESTHAAKLVSEDRRVDFDAPVETQLATIRLGNAWAMVGDRRLKILDAAITDGALVIHSVQPEGKRPMSLQDWQRGTPPSERGPLQ